MIQIKQTARQILRSCDVDRQLKPVTEQQILADTDSFFVHTLYSFPDGIQLLHRQLDRFMLINVPWPNGRSLLTSSATRNAPLFQASVILRNFPAFHPARSCQNWPIRGTTWPQNPASTASCAQMGNSIIVVGPSRPSGASLQLGRVDVHFNRITVAAIEMNALKLASVLQQRIAIPLYSLSFPKKFSIKCRHL
jgi:hypothetical protein